jgi:hypothetical protein
LDALYYDLFKIRREYREQIDKAIEHKKKQTEEIMKLLEPTYSTEWDEEVAIEEPVFTPPALTDADAREFNKHWIDFEKDMNTVQRRYYLELSQKNKFKAFEQWKRTEGGHCDYKQLAEYQFNYEK